jgi:SF-assemblin/beta giardin
MLPAQVPTSTHRQHRAASAGLTSGKLEHVSGKFTSLYTDLESGKQQKRLTEHETLALLKERIDGLEGSLQAEIARRHDADRALQAHFDAELHKLSERTAGEAKQLQLAIKGGVEQLNRSMRELNCSLCDEREQRRVDIDHVAGSLCERVQQVAGAIEEERVQRQDQERQSLRRYADERRARCNRQRSL